MVSEILKPPIGRLGPDHPLFPVIDEGYRVFSRHPPTTTGVSADCGMSAEIEKNFFKPAVRDLPLQYLRDWFFAEPEAHPIPKGVWAYLLPRILELLAAGEVPPYVGLEVTLNRFPTGDQTQWTRAEWSLIDRFQREWLVGYVQSSCGFLDNAICMFGLAHWPLDELFLQVLDLPDRDLIERLFADWCFPDGGGSIWITAFWDEAGRAKALDFYVSNSLYERLSSFVLEEASDPSLAEKASRVLEVIEATRRANAS